METVHDVLPYVNFVLILLVLYLVVKHRKKP
jgi:hypothetical protein